MPNYSYISFYGRDFVMFGSLSSSSYQSTILSEPSLARAFEDFFTSIQETNLIQTKEETLAILDKYIDSL